MKQRVSALVERVKAWHAYRAWTRFTDNRGNLLAAGIAYFAFFSLFPAFALAAVVFGFVLRGRPDLIEAVGTSLNESLPGFVRTAQNPDGLIQLAAPESATLSWAGAIAVVTLVLGGLGWIGSLREGIRAVFGVTGPVGNAVLAKVRDVVVLVLLGVAVLASAVLTSVAGAAASWVAGLIGFGDASWALAAAGIAVSLLVDTAIMVLLLRLLSGVALPWHDVRNGALVGGAGMTVLKLVGAQLVARATANPLFGSIVVVVGLLFWLNLIARLVLVSAAWAANDIDHALAELEASRPTGELADHSMGVDATDPRARARGGIPDVGALGQRDRDRVSLAAGVVVGAGAAVGLGAAGRVLRLLTPRR